LTRRRKTADEEPLEEQIIQAEIQAKLSKPATSLIVVRSPQKRSPVRLVGSSKSAD